MPLVHAILSGGHFAQFLMSATQFLWNIQNTKTTPAVGEIKAPEIFNLNQNNLLAKELQTSCALVGESFSRDNSTAMSYSDVDGIAE